MDVSSNPWTIDAVDVATTPATVWRGKVFVTNIELVQYVAPTDTALINQYNGKFFAFLQGASDLETVRTGNLRHADGIVIPTLGITNGRICIYHL